MSANTFSTEQADIPLVQLLSACRACKCLQLFLSAGLGCLPIAVDLLNPIPHAVIAIHVAAPGDNRSVEKQIAH